jgi:ParB-like chromosome segregation protein Spo0J
VCPAEGGQKAVECVFIRQVDDGKSRVPFVLEACLALGEITIPVVVVQAAREEECLMSLVENIARHPPSNRDILREVKNLLARNCKPEEIARKLGLDRTYRGLG